MARSRDVVNANPTALRSIDRVLTVQRPVVLAHIRSIRRGRPNATPAEIIRIIERRYLAAVTVGGGATGAAAAIPAVGTGVALALSGVETAGFLEMSALFAQSVTEVHGIVVDDPERARALVMTMVLGTAGTDLLKQLVGQASGGPGKSAFWGEMVTKSLPRAVMGPITDRIKQTFLKRFAITQGSNVVGRLLPFGIGAVIGGSGNLLLGRQIVRTARDGFGPAPETFPAWLEPTIRAPKPPKPSKTPRAPREVGELRKLRIPLPSLPQRHRPQIEPPAENKPLLPL